MSFRLRDFQRKLKTYLERTPEEAIMKSGVISVNGTPGSGKSLLPVLATHFMFQRDLIDKVIWVVPRKSLRLQAEMQFQEPNLRKFLGHEMEIIAGTNEAENPAREYDGYAITYDMLVSDLANKRRHINFVRNYRTLLVLDEVHHVGEKEAEYQTWKNAVEPLYDAASFRILMSGTMERHDRIRVFKLPYAYEHGTGKELPYVTLTYGLRDAIRDKVIIKSSFQFVDSEGAYKVNSSEELYEFDTLTGTRRQSKMRLGIALSTQYAKQLLDRGLNHWKEWRKTHSRSKMLVVCDSIEQAKVMQERLQRKGVSCARATSDDPKAADIISNFRDKNSIQVLITVQMAYEGMDVPSITHVVYLSRIRSQPWIEQMIGRATRFDVYAGPWESQKAFFFVPDDPMMRNIVRTYEAQELAGIKDQIEAVGGGGIGLKINTVEPVRSQETTSYVQNLDFSDVLVREGCNDIEELMAKYNITGNPEDVIKLFTDPMFQEVLAAESSKPEKEKSNQPNENHEPEEEEEEGILRQTPSQRKRTLRNRIHRQCSVLDEYEKTMNPLWENGDWNKKRMTDIQGGKHTKDLTEEELQFVWEWICQRSYDRGVAIVPKNPETRTCNGY